MKNENPSTKPITNLFHDPAYYYISNIEPAVDEKVTLRLRTEKDNVKKAFVLFSHDSVTWEEVEMTYEKDDKTGYYSFFKGTLPGQSAMFKYYFRVENDDPANAVYYARDYIGTEAQSFDDSHWEKNDLLWVLVPGYHTPDWAKGTLWYNIMPDCYYNGDLTNDELQTGQNYQNSWNSVHHDLVDKYGGDLRGIEKKVDYIRDLGCESIFFNPIFRSTQNAGYGPEFYSQIENSFGNARALQNLAQTVHKNGMRYMIDVVFAFTTTNSIYYSKNNNEIFPTAAQDWNSPYHDFYYFTGKEGDTKSFLGEWGGLQLNHDCKRLCEEIYLGKDAYLPYYCSEPFNVDAIRYDCGGSLHGKTKDGKDLNDADVVGAMRPVLRKINPEILMLSEYSFNRSVDKGVWDSRWNLEFVGYTRDYIDGKRDEDWFRWKYNNEFFSVPRTFALCQFNSMSDHDRPRNHKRPKWAIRPQQMIHMTMVGSPSIYYGDEFNICREGATFYAMEWDESNWEYETLYFEKSLIELRKTYSCLRDGAFKYCSVDKDRHIFSFARFNADSTVITVASRNPYPTKIALDVRDLEALDGTVFTDWLTGKHYVAENGYIDVELMAGGSVFVKGDAWCKNYIGELSLHAIGGGDSVVTMDREKAITIQGKGSVSGKADSFLFASTEVFNGCAVSAQIEEAGNALLMIRNSIEENAAFVAVGVQHGKVYVAGRKTDGAASFKHMLGDAANPSYYKITRDHSNQFALWSARTPGAGWTLLCDGIHADLDNHAKAGIAVLSGNSIFDDRTFFYEKKVVPADDFRHGKSAMFDYGNAGAVRYTKNGLTLTPNGKAVWLETNSGEDDWTFKSKIAFAAANENEYAGIFSMQDEDTYVTAGRTVENGKPILYLGRATAGKFVIFHRVPDTAPNRKVTIQLQRIGTTYSAVYSYNETNWKLIGRNLFANLSLERVGLIASGNTAATFDYASFGDAIHDGASVNLPITPAKISLDTAFMADVDRQPTYRIVSGEWSYAKEGLMNKSKSFASVGITDKLYRHFRFDATYRIDEGKGFVGVEFGKAAYNSAFGDGCLVALDEKGTVIVKENGKVLAKEKVDQDLLPTVHLCVDCCGNSLTVYAGQNGKVLLTIPYEPKEGSMAYVSDGVVCHIGNYSNCNMEATLYHQNPYRYQKDGFTNEWIHMISFITPSGVAVTDFVLRVKLGMHDIFNNTPNPIGGIFLSSEGKFLEDTDAFGIRLDHKHNLALTNGIGVITNAFQNIKTYANANLDAGLTHHDLMVVKSGKTITVYADGGKEPLLKHELAVNFGGTVSFLTYRCKFDFIKPMMENLQPGADPTQTRIYKNWMK